MIIITWIIAGVIVEKVEAIIYIPTIFSIKSKILQYTHSVYSNKEKREQSR